MMSRGNATLCLWGVALLCGGLLFYYRVYVPEWQDRCCPEGGYTRDVSVCRDGCGVAYSGSKPEPSDTVAQLLDKITIAATVGSREVMWRRALIVAVISVGIYMVAGGNTANPTQALTILMCVFIVSYGMGSYMAFHHYAFPQENILEATRLIKQKVGTPPPPSSAASRTN